MNDVIQVRGDVPPEMHPAILDREVPLLDVQGTTGVSVLAAGREALSAAYKVFGAMEDAERALQAVAGPARRRQTPDGRSEYLGDLRMVGGNLQRFHGHEEEFAAAAEQAFNRTASTMDRRKRELDGYRDSLVTAVEHALDYPLGRAAAGVTQAQEIRSYARSRPTKERVPLFFAAVEADDHQTVAALLTAPSYLSGLSAEEAARIRHHAASRWAKTPYAQLGAVDVVLERVMEAGSKLTGRYARALKQRDTAKAEASSKLGALARA